MSGRRRSAAEWTVFAVSCVVLAVVLALIVIEIAGDEQPAAPSATTVDGAARRNGSRYFVDVDVINDGDRAATRVQVVAELTINGETTDADQVIDVLAGGERKRMVFIFADDPAAGELDVRVAGFTEP